MEGKDLPGRLVIVTWHDAHADVSGWLTLSDIDPEPCVVHSVGILLEDAKAGHVSLCQSSSDGRLDSILHIPRLMVVEVETLEIGHGSTAAPSTPHRGLPEKGKPSWLPGAGRAGETDPAARVLKTVDRSV